MTQDHSFAVSIVSHGQGHLVRQLLLDLAPFASPKVEVIVTLNRPEDESFLDGHPYPIRVVRNNAPKGFGANHNRACSLSDAPILVVLNPDLRCRSGVFEAVADRFVDPQLGVCAPVVRSTGGSIEDSARRDPEIGRIVRRVWNRMLTRPNPPDYSLQGSEPVPVDWVAGMFMMFRAEAFRRVGGFDERYFMYLEDADICRRLRTAGCLVMVDTQVTVVHDAQRASRRSWQHLRWHMTSMLRYLFF